MNVETIKTIAIPLIEAEHLFLVDVKCSALNIIEITVDAINGVNIDTCIKLSREIEEKFDRDAEDFELTVSSAGIGRVFKVEGQFLKNIGNNVDVVTKDGNKYTGILKRYENGDIDIEIEEKVKLENKKKKELVKRIVTINHDNLKTVSDVVKF